MFELIESLGQKRVMTYVYRLCHFCTYLFGIIECVFWYLNLRLLYAIVPSLFSESKLPLGRTSKVKPNRPDTGQGEVVDEAPRLGFVIVRHIKSIMPLVESLEPVLQDKIVVC